ncbi:MAG: FlgD immunoglobulin-like domain containing protein [candidate division WOR-3 bacterium]
MKIKLSIIFVILVFGTSNAEVWKIGHEYGIGAYDTVAYVKFTIPNQYYTHLGDCAFYAGKHESFTYRSALEDVSLNLPIDPYSVIEACSIKFNISYLSGSPITVEIRFAQSFDIGSEGWQGAQLYSQIGNATLVGSYTFNSTGEYFYPFDYSLLTAYSSGNKMAIGFKSADESASKYCYGKIIISVNHYQLPGSPPNFQVSPGATTADFTWNDPSGPQDGFFLDISLEPFPNNNYQRHIIPNPNATFKRVTGLEPQTYYYARICGYRQGVYNRYPGEFSYTEFQTATPGSEYYLSTWGEYEGGKPPVHLHWHWEHEFPGVPPTAVDLYALFDDQYPPYPWANTYRQWWPSGTLDGYTWLWYSPYHYWIGAKNNEGWPPGSNLPWLFSNDFTVYPGGGADPVVIPSVDTLALYPCWSQKIVVDSLENIHIVYTYGDSVYYIFSNDEGHTFSPPMPVAQGKFPALGISNAGLEVVYLRENKIYLTRKTENWSQPILVYENPALTSLQPPALAVDKENNIAHLVWDEQFADYAQISKAAVNLTNPGVVIAHTLDRSPIIQDFASPSTSIRRDGIPIVTWSKMGKVYLNDGMETKVIETGDGYAINPMVAVVGDNIKIIWTTTDSLNNKEQLKYTEKTWWGWTDPILLKEGNFTTPPIITGTGHIFYCEKENGVSYLKYLGIDEEGWHIYSRPIVYTENAQIRDLNAYNFMSWQKNPVYTIFLLPDDPAQVKLTPVPGPDISTFYLNCGFGENPYAVANYSSFRYSNLPVHNIDVDSVRLEYRVSGLNPEKRYRLKITAFQDEQNEVREWVKIDNKNLGLFMIPKGKISIFEKWLPNSVYNDGEVYLTLQKDNGFAIASQIFIKEFERGAEENRQGSVQSAFENSAPIMLSVYPNPFGFHINVTFQVRQKGSVNLKVYDEMGRLVKDLSQINLSPGLHTITWDGADNDGKPVANGVYFLISDNGKAFSIRKIILIK